MSLRSLSSRLGTIHRRTGFGRRRRIMRTKEKQNMLRIRINLSRQGNLQKCRIRRELRNIMKTSLLDLKKRQNRINGRKLQDKEKEKRQLKICIGKVRELMRRNNRG